MRGLATGRKLHARPGCKAWIMWGTLLRGANCVWDAAEERKLLAGCGCGARIVCAAWLRARTACQTWVQGENRICGSIAGCKPRWGRGCEERTYYNPAQWISTTTSVIATLVCHRAIHLVCAILGRLMSKLRSVFSCELVMAHSTRWLEWICSLIIRGQGSNRIGGWTVFSRFRTIGC